MKYIGELATIFLITLAGETLNIFLPFSIPGSIYGLIVMLLCLQLKIIKFEKVENVGNFLLNIMFIMFVPAGVRMTTIWTDVAPYIVRIVIISIITTIIVMVVTGIVTDFILRKSGFHE